MVKIEFGDSEYPFLLKRIPNPPKQLYVEGNKEILNKALKSLTKKQRKRIILHYSGMTEREIAKIEKVDQKTIHESIDKAEKHLKNAKLSN